MRANAESVFQNLIPGLHRSRWVFLAVALAVLSACDTLALNGEEPVGGAQAAAPAQSAPPRGPVVAANRALDAKDYERAYTVLREHLILNPDDDAAKLALARTYLARREGRYAQTVLNSMSPEAQDSANANTVRGLALLLTGDLLGATAQLETALEKDPSLWRAANGLGLIADLERDWEAAEANYKRALEQKSDAAQVHNNLGYSYLLQGRVEEAVEALTESLSHDPGLEIARSNLRIALAAQGRYTAAAAGSDRTTLPQVLNNIGFVAMQLGDYETAEVFFTRAIAESPVYYDTAQENLQRLRTITGDQQEQRPVRSQGN